MKILRHQLARSVTGLIAVAAFTVPAGAADINSVGITVGSLGNP